MTFIAKPSVFNMTNSKEFETISAAKKYLDEFTGYTMKADEWVLVGKLLKVDENSQLIPALDIQTISV